MIEWDLANICEPEYIMKKDIKTGDTRRSFASSECGEVKLQPEIKSGEVDCFGRTQVHYTKNAFDNDIDALTLIADGGYR